MRLSDENLHGRTVLASDGIAIGKVAALFLDSGTWRVESLLVSLYKDIADRLGAGHSLFRAGEIEVATHRIQSVGDAVVLSVAVDELRQKPPVSSEPAHAE